MIVFPFAASRASKPSCVNGTVIYGVALFEEAMQRVTLMADEEEWMTMEFAGESFEDDCERTSRDGEGLFRHKAINDPHRTYS